MESSESIKSTLKNGVAVERIKDELRKLLCMYIGLQDGDCWLKKGDRLNNKKTRQFQRIMSHE